MHDEEYVYDEESGTYVPASQLAGDTDDQLVVRDANGATLASGDDVHIIKDLKVGSSSMTLKRGTVIKNIRLLEGDEDNIECRIGKSTLVLKTCFLKKK